MPGQRILMVNGSPRQNGGTSATFQVIRNELQLEGAMVSEAVLNQLDFRGCQGCMGCKRRDGCVLRDDLTPVLNALRSADGLILGSPIYMFAISGQASLFLNRLYSLIDAGYQPRAGRYRKLMTVYSMGSPSSGRAITEEQRVQQAFAMLGFIETERIEVTGIMPGALVARLPERQATAIATKARAWIGTSQA